MLATASRRRLRDAQPWHLQAYRRWTRYGDALIRRNYCRWAHTTFSLLPLCFAARLPEILDDVETAMAAVETAPTLAAAAARLRPHTVKLNTIAFRTIRDNRRRPFVFAARQRTARAEGVAAHLLLRGLV